MIRYQLRILAATLIFASAGSTSSSAGPVPSDKLPAFAVPKVSNPPRIDGTIGTDEWREAVAISGVANQQDNFLFPRPTTFFLAWDDDHLYLACRTWVMPGYKPHISGRSTDTASVGDDGMELHFQPLGKNVAEGRTDSSYKFFVNCLGMSGEYVRVAVGQLFRNWLPQFRCAARLTGPGTAPKGGQWSECEMSASTRDFELSGPNRAGDKWKFMLGFNHMPMWMQARIPSNSGYFNPDAYCEGTLTENTPAVQVTMEELPGPCDGTGAVTLRAYNPTAKAVLLDFIAEFSDIRKKQTLRVEPGKSGSFSLREKLPDSLKKGHIYYRVSEGKRELFRYFAFFKVGYPESQMKFVPPESAFPFTGVFNPIRLSLFIDADAYYLNRPEDAKEVRYEVRHQDGKDILASGKLTKPLLSRFTKLVQLPALEEGQYVVEAFLHTKDGERLGPEQREFVKLDESKAFGEWWKKGLGPVDRVIPPFVPMTRSGNRITVWGRSYTLNGLGLPDAVQSREGQVMASPSRLVLRVNGREEVVSLRGRPKFKETTRWRVQFEGKARSLSIRFSSKGFIEQDGLLWLEMTYEPLTKKPVTIESLRFEYPVADEQADSLLCLGTGGNYSARTTMLVPRKKEGLLWSTLDTGRLGASMTVGSFYPCVWLGSERRGLLWWGDSDRGWVPDNDVPAHEVLRHGAEVILRNNIIGAPFELSAPRTIKFGLMASPFRPLVKNWRSVLSSYDGTFSGGESWGYKWRKDPKTGKPYDGWNLLTPPSDDPDEWSTIWSEYKKKSDAKIRKERPFNPGGARNWMFVHTSLPLVGYGWKSPDKETTGYFAPEWGNSESYTDSNIDYYLYLADRAFREGGLKTIYWDIFFPILHRTI